MQFPEGGMGKLGTVGAGVGVLGVLGVKDGGAVGPRLGKPVDSVGGPVGEAVPGRHCVPSADRCSGWPDWSVALQAAQVHTVLSLLDQPFSVQCAMSGQVTHKGVDAGSTMKNLIGPKCRENGF